MRIWEFGAPSGAHAQRVIFIDLARALAVLFMLYGHSISALLAPQYQSGTWYEVWQFQRGLTSSLFLLLSGFAFSIATSRHWASHLTLSSAVWKRIRRFVLFIVLGYALHLPVGRFVHFRLVTEQGWRAFVAVDILQLIGVTFVTVQLLVWLTRSRQWFMVATSTLAITIVAMTPLVWSTEWTHVVPLPLAAYLSPSAGSLFPLFPWAGFVLLGAAFGQMYARWGAANLPAYANFALLAPGAALVAAASLISLLPEGAFGTGPGRYVPGDVVQRWGVSLLVLGVIAHGTRRISRLPHVFSAVAQETLLIYFVHLCIVYGSVWNRGLVQMYGKTLAPPQMLLVVVALVAAMAALAWYWNGSKHARPQLARWTSVVVAALLLGRLL